MEMIYYRGDHDGDTSSNAINTKFKAAKAGAKAIIQPGGSIRDEEVIAQANEYGMTMIFTGKRHFKH